MGEMVITRIPRSELVDFTRSVFIQAGLNERLTLEVADALIEADMMGHETHGLALVPTYLRALASGAMSREGEVEVLSDLGACVTWDGHKLPGAAVARQAVDLGIERAGKLGCCTVAITNSYHLGALAVYLLRATESGMMAILASSTPSVTGVAPFGGTVGIMTPNPIAAGIPTNGDPILLDISASITTRNKAMQYAAEGRKFPSDWALDATGRPTNDPHAIMQGGTLLPLGGLDHGHKGYALGLLVEALTQGFSGISRADRPTGTYTSAFLQVLDPRAFAGPTAFNRSTDFLVEACRGNPPRAGVERVRVPGDRAMSCRREAEEIGVPLSELILEGLRVAAREARLDLPPGLA